MKNFLDMIKIAAFFPVVLIFLFFFCGYIYINTYFAIEYCIFSRIISIIFMKKIHHPVFILRILVEYLHLFTQVPTFTSDEKRNRLVYFNTPFSFVSLILSHYSFFFL